MVISVFIEVPSALARAVDRRKIDELQNAAVLAIVAVLAVDKDRDRHMASEADRRETLLAQRAFDVDFDELHLGSLRREPGAQRRQRHLDRRVRHGDVLHRQWRGQQVARDEPQKSGGHDRDKVPA